MVSFQGDPVILHYKLNDFRPQGIKAVNLFYVKK